MTAIAKRLALPILAGLALALPAANASASGGRLDRYFGHHGRVLIGNVRGLSAPLFAAAAPGGKTVIATPSQVLRVNSRGRLDRRFGEHGWVDLPARAGARFTPSGLAVDGSGRVVLAGTSQLVTAAAPSPRTVFLERLLADGEPDPSFGESGRVESTLGLPTAPAYGAPSVEARGLTIDAKGRPIIAGSFVAETRTCETYIGTFFEADSTRGFVARLTIGGRLDPRFANGGDRVAPMPSRDSLPLIDRVGRITYSEALSPTGCPERGISSPSLLRGLDPSGGPRIGFDARQSSPLLFAQTSAQDSKMRTVLLGTSLGSNGMGIDDEEVVRVRPTGTIDGSFGDHGHAPAASGPATVAAIAVDPRNRVVLAGSNSGAFYLGRLNARGETDARFGFDGSVRTSFGKWSPAAMAVAIDSRGRIVVIGPAATGGRGESRLALARYLPGSGHRAKH